METAAIIANCDLIITSDTAVAHLAAGMGHPTWLLLTKVPEWRWGIAGDTSFWYPSMRLFRQRERGNWAEVMDRVATVLETLVSRPVKQAVAVNPEDPEAHCNLGVALGGQGDLQAAVDAFGRALAITPDFPEAHYNLGKALQEQGDLEAATKAYGQALAINPDYANAHWNLSLLQLLQGDYGRGWKGYEWRFQTKDDHRPHANPQIERWNGSNLAPGENLLLVSEQGLGDTLHFMRYVLYLNNRGWSVSLCAQTKLHGLIQASGITTRLYNPEQAKQLTTGKWFPLLSLPGYLQVRPDHPVVESPYIKAPEQRVEHWQQKLATEQRSIIGINWQGSPGFEKGVARGRSLPLESFAPITGKTTVRLLSLQKGDGAEQLADCSFRHRFVGCQEEINQTWDFVETAAIVANCDLIITCDTAVAHLAAGMGPPHLVAAHHSPGLALGHDGRHQLLVSLHGAVPPAGTG